MKFYPSKFAKGLRPSGLGRLITIDTETIGLTHEMSTGGYYKGLPENMHVIVAKDIISKEVFVFFDPFEKRRKVHRVMLNDWEDRQDGYLEDGIKFLMESECIISQNFMGFDALALEICFGDKWKLNYRERRVKGRVRSGLCPLRVMDTLVMSQLLNPDRKLPTQAYAMKASCGAHTIEAHGIRIGRYKPDNEDWSHLTDHMVHRCIEDVEIGMDMFFWLYTNEWTEHMQRGANPRTKKTILTALTQETQEALTMARQAYRGWRLDMPKSVGRYDELNREIDRVDANFRPRMPVRLCSKPFPIKDKDEVANKILEFLDEYYADASYNPYDDDVVPVYTFGKVGRRGKYKTVWKITKKNGEFDAGVTKHYPNHRGCPQDLPKHKRVVSAPFTPIEYEDIPLGNRETVKELIYPYGWRGVTFNQTDEDYINENGELPKPWSGKIDEKSMDAWRERAEAEGYIIPEWCEGIAAWYILCSRRGQILNRGDIDKYLSRVELQGKEYAEFPRQVNGKNQIRGLVARAYNFELAMEAQEYFRLYGCWPTDGQNDPCKHDDNWRVPAQAVSIGTNTFRMRHKNVVNIPSRGLFPLRDLFIASRGKLILGCDGAGLELRMLAHFLNDLLYTEIVLNGDIHTHNQNLAGLPIRDMAKTFIYAFLYGSGIPNLAAVCGMTEAKMRDTVERFKAELPALTNLITGIEAAGNKFGYMLAVDGRWGRIRKKDGSLLVHTILNVLLQMTGSLCMKYSQCWTENKMFAEGVGLDEKGFPAFLANVHDELQCEVNECEVLEKLYEVPKAEWKKEEKAEHHDAVGMWSAPRIQEDLGESFLVRRRYHRVGELMALSMVWAGEFLKIRIPLAGEYMIGNSWHDTH